MKDNIQGGGKKNHLTCCLIGGRTGGECFSWSVPSQLPGECQLLAVAQSGEGCSHGAGRTSCPRARTSASGASTGVSLEKERALSAGYTG